jgi:hypothetical protein
MHLTTKQNMTHIEQLHLEAINDTEYELIKHSAIYQIDKDKAASKSAAITKQIAIEFAKFIDDNSDEPQFDLVQWTYESWFEEFLKSKQPNDGIQTS